MKKVINLSGTEIIWESAFELMDDEIANEIANMAGIDTEQDFMTDYEKAHADKYGEEWELSKSNPTY